MTIVALSLVALVLGATVLGVFIYGPSGILGGLSIAITECFNVVPIAILVSIALALSNTPFFQRGLGICVFMLSGALAGAMCMRNFGISEQGNEAFWIIANTVAGGVSGATAAGLIILLRRLCLPAMCDDVSGSV